MSACNLFSNSSLKDGYTNPIDELWGKERPDMPRAPLRVHPERCAVLNATYCAAAALRKPKRKHNWINHTV